MMVRDLKYYVCVTVMCCYNTVVYRDCVMCVCVTVMCCYSTVVYRVTVMCCYSAVVYRVTVMCVCVCYCNVLLQYSLCKALPFRDRK
jgi:hypothetical protein